MEQINMIIFQVLMKWVWKISAHKRLKYQQRNVQLKFDGPSNFNRICNFDRYRKKCRYHHIGLFIRQYCVNYTLVIFEVTNLNESKDRKHLIVYLFQSFFNSNITQKQTLDAKSFFTVNHISLRTKAVTINFEDDFRLKTTTKLPL